MNQIDRLLPARKNRTDELPYIFYEGDWYDNQNILYDLSICLLLIFGPW